MEIDDVMRAYQRCRPAHGDAWYATPLRGELLYATKDQFGCFGLFIRGSLESFGALPRSSAIAHQASVQIEPSGITIPVLRILAPRKSQGNRALVYIACEACKLLDDDSKTGVDELVRRLHWMLILLEDDSSILTPERQRGLVGELHLLTRLLRMAGPGPQRKVLVLSRWHGSSFATRDFSGPDVAVEVKATSNPIRSHIISSMEQLEPHDESENVFLYSAGIRHDPSAPRRLHHYIADVEVMLTGDELSLFREKLTNYGYDVDRPELYDAEPGLAPFHLDARLFAVSELDRLVSSSFVGGRPPVTVSQISYRLLIASAALSAKEETLVYERLIA